MSEQAAGVSRRDRMAAEWGGLPGWVRAVVTVVVLVAVVAVAGVLMSVVGDARAERGAVEACEGYVKDSLKSPASAEFSDAEAARRGAFGFDVTGVVDSQNGFGAMVRNRFDCSVNEVGGDWLLIDLQFEDRN